MKDSRTKEDIYRKFQNPAREYRGTPFWSWNAEMTPEEVRRQVRELYEQGVGGSLSWQGMDGLCGSSGG